MNATLISWKRERLGLIMVGTSLFAIACMVMLLFGYLQQQRQEQIREQGVGLVRILSGLSYEQLVAGQERRGILSLLQHHYGNSDFAYATFVTPSGDPIAQVAASGTIVPSLRFSAQPTSWLKEQVIAVPGSRPFQEFNAPMFTDGTLSGYVRVGYFQPGFGLNKEQLAFFGTLVLPIFLLTPLFYYLIKKEVQPLKKINSEIEHFIENRSMGPVQVDASGELGQFMERFNKFVEFAQQKITSLESDQAGLVTSTKLLGYKRARVESVIQSLPDAVLVLDETGTITVANPRVTTLLGVDHKEIIGTQPQEWCSNPEVLALLAGHKSKGMGVYNTEAVHFSSEHSPEKTLVANAYPLFSKSNRSQMLGTLLVFRDATLEQKAKQSRAEFVAHVAHELKSPLNVLAMYSEALQGKEGESETFRIETANVIHDEVERLSTLISNILSITKIEMGSLGIKRQRVKLREFLQDALDRATRDARGKDFSISLDAPKELNAIHVDKALLSIALNNLLTNAVKYNRPGGSIVLATEENDEAVRISVRDTGIGIAPQDQGRIFEKFYRSNAEEVRQRTGHGLGLALSKEIVQLHHGTLTVHSKLGEGAEFVIELMKHPGSIQQGSQS
ncbi:MAG: PAS domain-containing sensor histidine kinase [Gammaproteobacteria bacterium]